MRRAALLTMLAMSALCWPGQVRAECADPAACVDAEPLWFSPAARRFAAVSDTRVPALGKLGGNATFTFRLKPALLTVPAPNRDGREVNLISHATDVSLGAVVGIGTGMELTLVVPAGLYQRGAGIKGVTHQEAPAIAAQSLHDPRVGFGYALGPRSSAFGAKLRLELKLPLGDEVTLSGERSFVASPSFALHARAGGWFGGAELGARLRRPSELFGSRVGSQAVLALGAGWGLARPRLSFSVEGYALPSLVASAAARYLPAEWLASARFSPSAAPRLSFGLGGGTALPLSSDPAGWFAGLGAPSFRGLLFVRLSPDAE